MTSRAERYLATVAQSQKMVRVFINHVDTYGGKAVSEVLGSAIVGATNLEDRNDAADEVTNDASEGDSATPPQYEIIGSLSHLDAVKPKCVSGVIESDKILSALISCDIIIYHTIGSNAQVDEASWAIQSLHDDLSSFASQKVFICVSSILTWARTKPLDPDEPDIPFTEEDYRRRKPHPNYKDLASLEKVVIKLGKTDKSKLISYVVAAGLTYGQGENILHYLFKTAWHGNIEYLPVFGDGQNVIPSIHILDLASVLLNIADNRPKTKYIIAVDDSQSTLHEIIRAISMGLGPKKIKHVPKDDAMLIRDISQWDNDQLLVNLQMEATLVKESMNIEWVAETGLVENITKVIKEYKETRELLPIRGCILGPPASGKTYVASQLCQMYKLHHIKIADVIKEAIDKLERTVARADIDDSTEDGLGDDDNDDGDDEAQRAQELLDIIKEDYEESDNGRYSEQYIIEFYKQKLRSLPCQNQGFILDGFPKTLEQAKALFSPDDNDAEDDDEESNGEPAQFNKLTMPEIVVSLNASDDFLKERVMNLPESEVAGTHNTEEGFLRRLQLFQTENEEDITVLNYFDELEIHPEHINVEQDKSQGLSASIEKICKLIGEPRNYGPTQEEKAEMERRAHEIRIAKEAHDREIKEKMEQEEKELRAQREAEWNAQLVLVLKEEKELMESRSMPLRNYLMRHVMPTLTKGLIEACKVKPEDPVDYLAEYLFKHNPQID